LNLTLLYIASKTLKSVKLLFGGIFDYEAKSTRLAEIQKEWESPHVWENKERAQALGKERAELQNIVDSFTRLKSNLSDSEALLELASEDNDENTFHDALQDLD